MGSIHVAPHVVIDVTSLFGSGWYAATLFLVADEASLEPFVVVTSGDVKSGKAIRFTDQAENTYEVQVFLNPGDRVLLSLSSQGLVLISIDLQVTKVSRLSAITRSAISNLAAEKGISKVLDPLRKVREAQSKDDFIGVVSELKAAVSVATGSLSERKLFRGQLDADLIHLLQIDQARTRFTSLIVQISIDGIFDDQWRRCLGSLMSMIGLSKICLIVSGQSVPKLEAVKFIERMSILYGVVASFELDALSNLESTAMLLCSTAREYRPDSLFVASSYFGDEALAVYGTPLVRDVTGTKVKRLGLPTFQRHLALASSVFVETAIFDALRFSQERFGGFEPFSKASTADVYFEVANLSTASFIFIDEPLALFESSGNKGVFRYSSSFENDRYAKLLDIAEPNVSHEIFDELNTKIIRRNPKLSPSVAVVIPMRDRADLTRNCVASVRHNCTYPNYRLIVVDNGSVEVDSKELFEELSQDGISIISYPFDFNFAAITNFAVDNVDDDFVLLLNNDIEVKEGDFISEMVALALLEDVGVVGQKLLYPDGDVQHCGVRLGIGEAMTEHFQMRVEQPEFGQYLAPVQFSAVTGAAMLLSRTLFQEVGGMDATHLKVSYNDIDLCLKVRSAEKIVINNPFSEIIHFESKSRGIDGISLEKIKRNTNERAYMVARWDEFFTSDSLWPSTI